MRKVILVMMALALAFSAGTARSQEQKTSGDYTDAGDETSGFEDYLATDDDDEDLPY